MITTNLCDFVVLSVGGGSIAWQAFDGFDTAAKARNPFIGNAAPNRAGKSWNSSII